MRRNLSQQQHHPQYQSTSERIYNDNYLHKIQAMCITVFVSFVVILSYTVYYSQASYGTQRQSQDLQRLKQLFTTTKKLIQPVKTQSMYWFSLPISDIIINSDLDSLYRRDRLVYSIDRQIHLRGILLTQLVHNVNFQGEISIQLSPFDQSQQQKRKAIEKVLQYQKDFYEKHYQLSKYHSRQLPFCIVVPSYNNVNNLLYLRNLDSLFMQDYSNYHIVYIDDNSPEKTGEHVLKYVKHRSIPDGKIQVYVNKENKKALRNIYQGIHQYCKDGEIVGVIDGDDSLNGRQVLGLYNAVYQKYRAGLVYSNFLKIQQNQRTNFGFGSLIDEQYLKAGYLRNAIPVIATHFMTFYADIFKKIKKEDFCYENGTFYDYAYDTALSIPLIELSFPRIYYLKQMTYEYRNDTGTNDGTNDWIRVSSLVKKQAPYESIKDFSFIDQNEIIRQAEHEITPPNW